jgi:Ala-tRNA(Pro) deacylase
VSHLKLFALFETHNITFTSHTHPPLFNVGDGLKLGVQIAGADSKNLFLKDKKDNFFLVSVLDSKRVDLKTLSKAYGKGGLSFASAEHLKNILDLIPGSVTPYGLLNDTEHKVTFILDADFLNYDLINFHPLQNDMTVSVAPKDFLTFCTLIDHTPSIIEIPVL